MNPFLIRVLGEGGGRRVQDGEHMYTSCGFILIHDLLTPYPYLAPPFLPRTGNYEFAIHICVSFLLI